MSPILTPPPPPPPDLIAISPLVESEFQGLPPLPLPVSPTPAPFFANFHADLLLSFGEPAHPELDEVIQTGDISQVSTELIRVRNQYPQPNVTFNTALRRAIQCGRSEVVSFLLSSGVPATERDLQAAAALGSIPIVACLMEHLAWSINTVANNGHTVLS